MTGPAAHRRASSLGAANPNSRAARPAAPASSSARSRGDIAASGVSNSWRTTPYAKSRSSSEPRALSVMRPSSRPRRPAAMYQARLADPGRALEQQQRATSGGRVIQALIDRGESRVSLQKGLPTIARGHRRRSYAAKTPRSTPQKQVVSHVAKPIRQRDPPTRPEQGDTMVAYITLAGSTPRRSQPSTNLLKSGTRLVNRRVELGNRPLVTR